MIWLAAACATGFGISAIFSALLHFPRGPFVLAHTAATAVFAALFFRYTSNDAPGAVRYRSGRAVVLGLVLGAILLQGVTDQPSGATPRGPELVAALAWYGLVYGAADALLLTVIPVMAAGGARRAPPIRILGPAAALGASLLVAASYHAGFEEYRGAALLQPLIGNSIITAGYLITQNPLTPILAHAIMHGAAVLHGMEATVQLPPHY